MNKLTEYTERLCEISARLKKYGEMASIAQYDMTATAPAGAAARRGELLAFIHEQTRHILLSPQTIETVRFLSEEENLSQLDDRMAGELRIYRRRIDAVTGVPEKLLSELSVLTQTTEQLWIGCKHTGEYGQLRKNLARIIALQKEVAECRVVAQNRQAPAHPLDPIIDEIDAGMTVEKLTILFDEIRRRTVPLLRKITESGYMPDTGFVASGCPETVQRRIAWQLLEKIGYSSRYGIVGSGEHPCTYGVNRWDVRFTDHFYEDNLLKGTISAMHEGGHGLYEMNVDPELTDLLVGSGSHGAMHESSSRFWENIIGRSLPFWEFAAPVFIRETGLDGVTPEMFWQAVNLVKPGSVRIYADELSYNLHIMMRFELEKQLFDGSLSVDDLDDAWDALTQEYLGVRPQKPAEGWAQDMHWPAGMFGYFQSYTLGNLYSAQIAAHLRKQMPDFDDLVRRGEFDPIRQWLTENWYRYGQIYTNEQLLDKMTGEPLKAGYLCDYLEEKFGRLYSL